MLKGNFTELNGLIALAETRSFSAAARSMDISTSALSHALKAMENRLGIRLFNRTTRAVALTEAGEALVSKVKNAMSTLEDALSSAALTRESPSGSIRISATETGATILIREVLPEFLDRYPDIHIEFVIDTKLLDIVSDGFDAGIRIFEDVPRDMVAIRFGPDVRFAAVASPTYLKKFGTPSSVRDLLKHRCIRFRFESGALFKWDLKKSGRDASLDVKGPMTLGNTNVMVQAALSGIGIAWVPYTHASHYIDAGLLVDLLPQHCPTFPGLCLYYPANRHVPMALRLFAETVRAWTQGKLNDEGRSAV